MRTQLTILLIDDEATVRSALRVAVETIGKALGLEVHILEAASALEAVSLQRESVIDLVLVDEDLRGGESGTAAVERMRDPFGRLMVVVISGASDQELDEPLLLMQRRFKLNFDYAQKPVSNLKIRSILLKCRDLAVARPLVHPLAIAVQTARQGPNPTLRLQAMERALELILKLNIFIMAGELVRRGRPSFESSEAGFAQMLTLGPWIGLANQLLKSYRILDDPFVPNLASLLKGSRGGVIGIVRSFKPVRDDEIHHGLPSDELGHEGRFEEFRYGFETLIDSLAYFRTLILAASEHVFMPAGGDFTYSMVVFMGETERFERVSLTLRDRLDDRRVYLFDPLLRRQSLYPFILWQNCMTCKRGRLFVLDNFKDGNFTHKDGLNHVITDAAASEAMLAVNAVLTRAVVSSGATN